LNSSEAKRAGFLTDSVIMADNLATVLDKAIVGKLGQLPDVKSVETALRVTLAL